MSRLHRLASLVLVALWLPVTLHCELEATGLFGPLTECVASGDDCCADTDCITVEEALFKESATALMVSAPAAASCLVSFAVTVPPAVHFAGPVLASARPAPPPELAVAWQFLSRAAPPARAPALDV